jgi:carboxypeptidase D
MARFSLALALLSLLGGTLFASVGTAALATGPSLRSESLNTGTRRGLEAAKRWGRSAASARGLSRTGNSRRDAAPSPPSRVKNITFTNPMASGAYARVHALPPFFLSHVLLEFYVDGATLPEIGFDVGPSWAGLMPISNATNETRKVLSSKTFYRRRRRLTHQQLFFWFFPPGPEGSLDDLIFWYVVYLDLCLAGRSSTESPRTNGGPGCSSLGGLLIENGVSRVPAIIIIIRTIT